MEELDLVVKGMGMEKEREKARVMVWGQGQVVGKQLLLVLG